MVAPVLAQVTQRYPNDVRVVYRHFPLPMHANSRLMAQASEAAALQGKFLEMEDAIFAGQAEWSNLQDTALNDWIAKAAQKIGLDLNKFQSDLNSQPVKDRVEKNAQEAQNAQLGGTPSLFINFVPLNTNSALDVNSLGSIIEYYKLSDRAYPSCPPMLIDTAKQYQATLKTEKGDIVIRLLADRAPNTVNSFVFLAREKWFNNITFHRVLPDFVAQTGDPSGTGLGNPGYAIMDENITAKYDKPGLVGMANSGKDTNGSQFFITYAPVPNLDGKYTIFGEVIQGMDVVKKLTPRNPADSGSLPPGDKILEVTITEK